MFFSIMILWREISRSWWVSPATGFTTANILLSTFPMFSKLLKLFQSQKVSCVLLVPKTWAPWRNLLQAHTSAFVDITEPLNLFAFTITLSRGLRSRVPKKYPFAMEAVHICFFLIKNQSFFYLFTKNWCNFNFNVLLMFNSKYLNSLIYL